MKTRFVIGLAVVCVVLGAFVWLWSLGAPPTTAASVVRLEQVEGQVEMRSSSTTAWQVVKEGESIKSGVSLRTGTTGSVTLTVSGVSQTRLGTSTEITIDAMEVAQGDFQSKTAIHLTSGHVWSRIVRLLELDSAYTVTTDDVVATVRGTTFDMARILGKETRLAVYDGSVRAGDRVIPKGSGMRTARGVMRFASSTAELPQDLGWIKKNTTADQTFLKEAQTELQTQLMKDVSPGVYRVFGTMAEKMRLTFTNETERQGLEDRYVGRRFALAMMLRQQGDHVQAQRELEKLKADMDASASDASTRLVFPRALMQASVLYQGETQQEMPEFLRLKIDGLKTQELNLMPSVTTPPRTVIPGDAQDIDANTTTLSPEKLPLTPPDVKVDSPALPMPDPTTQAPSPTSGLVPRALRFSPDSPTVIKVGQRVPLTVLVGYTDGSSRVINGLASFVSSDPAVAIVTDTLLDGRSAGTALITASYRENGVTVSGTMSITVSGDPQL